MRGEIGGDDQGSEGGDGESVRSEFEPQETKDKVVRSK